MKPAPLEFDTVVSAAELIADDILRVTVTRTDGEEFPEWEPGAHIAVILPSGLERQYSLCGQQEDSHTWTIAILKESASRGGSDWLHANTRAGTPLRVRGPSNHFALEPASSYRFIAAGIGITAILPMIRSANLAGIPWELDYAATSPDRAAFLDDVRSLSGGHARVHLSSDGQRFDVAALDPADGELIYACGPARLLDALSEQSHAWGPGTLHVERFEAIHPTTPVLNEPFIVDLVLSGITLEVSAEESILDAAETAGVFVLSSCREGTCGTCETTVVSGSVDHRDSILSDAEKLANDRMMICVSRAASSTLSLDL